MRQPLSVLYEADDLDRTDLPEPLNSWYGGPLQLSRRRLMANFVATLDGVVAMPAVPDSNRVISTGSEGDRFVMGLLRAYADVVLIGSGTLHGSPTTLWTAEDAYPAGLTAYGKWRSERGLPSAPVLAVMTGSGRIDVDHPALVAGALVLTTETGAAALRGRLPGASSMLVLDGAGTVDPGAAVDALRSLGHEAILSEAGPRVFGSLLRAGVVDDLFLTQSPLVAGRAPESPRLGLVEDTVLLPQIRVESRLRSIRRHSEHLFVHYRLDIAGASSPPPPTSRQRKDLPHD
jgi:riboflavin biosynthesis pyrimidine reductase